MKAERGGGAAAIPGCVRDTEHFVPHASDQGPRCGTDEEAAGKGLPLPRRPGGGSGAQRLTRSHCRVRRAKRLFLTFERLPELISRTVRLKLVYS